MQRSSSSTLTCKEQEALGKPRSMYSSSGAHTATHWTVAQSMSATSAQPAKPAVSGPWAQHQQQQQRPDSPNSDWNSPQGPPVRFSATHRFASLVGGDPSVIGAAQQHQKRPHVAHTLDLSPYFPSVVMYSQACSCHDIQQSSCCG